MFELIFKDDKKALKRLSKAQSAVEKFSKKHSGTFSKKEHKKFRKLLNNRALALSEATAMKIHSLFD